MSMMPSQGQLYMTLFDGREVEVNHVNPTKGQLLYKASTPTIFLKMSDESNLMLPIVVGEYILSFMYTYDCISSSLIWESVSIVK